MRSAIPSVLFLAGLAHAQGPADCRPPCRSGHVCIEGTCVSECNPPCASGYLCVGGECEADPAARPIVFVPTGRDGRAGFAEDDGDEDYIPYERYIAFGGGGTFLAKGPDGAPIENFGEVDIEHGARYWAGTITLAFPEEAFLFGAGFRVYYAFRLRGRAFVEPQVGLQIHSGFFDDARSFQVGLAPGLRLRYDVAESFAVYLQAFRADVMLFTTFDSANPAIDDGRVDETLVYLHAGAGIQIRY